MRTYLYIGCEFVVNLWGAELHTPDHGLALDPTGGLTPRPSIRLMLLRSPCLTTFFNVVPPLGFLPQTSKSWPRHWSLRWDICGTPIFFARIRLNHSVVKVICRFCTLPMFLCSAILDIIFLSTSRPYVTNIVRLLQLCFRFGHLSRYLRFTYLQLCVVHM
jgi:hypothetical protein